MGNRLNIREGDKFSKWVIIKEVGRKHNRRYFRVGCECGNIREIPLCSLRTGKSTRCGCCKGNICKTRIYKIWQGMKERCKPLANNRCKDYGYRGIVYDREWENFEQFYEDMKGGYKDDLTLDRIDNDGNYCKSNCRWATTKEQANNKRNNILIDNVSLKTYCRDKGLKYKRVHARLKMGWRLDRAIQQRDFRFNNAEILIYKS